MRLLEGAAASPDAAIGGLEILAAEERDRIVEGWNATSRAVGSGTLPELFASQAAATPDAIAAVYQDRELSYAALDAHSNRLAHHLGAQGVGAETVVGLLVDRSLEMVIGLLGILKAGAAYLPLDPSYPVERLSFMLSDAGCSVLVTQQALLERLGALAATHAHGAAADPARRRLGRHRAAARARPRHRHRARAGRLCDLHLGLNRNTKRRGGRAWRHVAIRMPREIERYADYREPRFLLLVVARVSTVRLSEILESLERRALWCCRSEECSR